MLYVIINVATDQKTVIYLMLVYEILVCF